MPEYSSLNFLSRARILYAPSPSGTYCSFWWNFFTSCFLVITSYNCVIYICTLTSKQTRRFGSGSALTNSERFVKKLRDLVRILQNSSRIEPTSIKNPELFNSPEFFVFLIDSASFLGTLEFLQLLVILQNSLKFWIFSVEFLL
jgi:hypothetical protein